MSDFKWVILTIIVIGGIILGGMYGIPKYNVWRSAIAIETAENNGKAQMAQATENRRIAVEEAKADLEVQELKSKAEVVRAKGMAESIEIENGKLTDRYIQYLWVRRPHNNNEVVYIPTETNLPILEARNRPDK